MKAPDAIIIRTGQAGRPGGAIFRRGQNGSNYRTSQVRRHLCEYGLHPDKRRWLPAPTRPILLAEAVNTVFTVNGDVRVDMKRVKARKDAVTGRSNKGVEDWLRGLKNCTVLQGHARFQSSNTVVFDDEVLQADKIYINVGGRAIVPEMPGIHDIPFLTNSSMMDIDFLPEHLVIVGGSYVGLEFAQMYRRFGSEVTILEMRPRLIGRGQDVSKPCAFWRPRGYIRLDAKLYLVS
jgi:hypothetical protein